MKIALYYPWIYLKSGVEKTILELTARSRHEWTIFTSHFDPDNSFADYKTKKVVELNKISVKRSYLSVLTAAVKIINQRIPLENYDVLWVHSEGLGDLITLRNHQKPIVCFCHTPLKVIHDPFTRITYLKNNPIKRPFYYFFARLFELLDKLAWSKYHYVFCVSDEVRKRILRANLTNPKKIEVIYRGIDAQKILPSWNYQRFFLLPGRIKWWKNLELSVDAFREFQKKFAGNTNFKLIIAGQVDRESQKYYQSLLKISREVRDITIIANPREEDLHRLYLDCYAVLNTTLNEDWGIVPLEAMAYGKPVIAVNQGGPRESVIDKETGFLVNPNAEAFAQAMVILMQNKELAQNMGKLAREKSLDYDWNKFISRVDSYLDSLKNTIDRKH